MIQTATEEVTIHYNKLHADPTQGESLDIILKKIKHRLVEAMSSSTADTLGLSRAILCNDSLVKRLQELQATEQMYKGLVEHAKRMLKAYFDLLQTFQDFGNAFAAISVREPQPRASEAFRLFGELHRQMEKDGVKMLKIVKPILSDLGTYLNKAIPDTKMTIRRYADAKFTYLSYCLKVKEMDDEEHSYTALQEPLYRVETGNYEYRLILRCRQEARGKFAKLRNDVLEKMELLESKHARDLAIQLKRFIEGLAILGTETVKNLKELPHLFPIEVDLKESAFQYKTNEIYNADADIDETPSITMTSNLSGNNDELLCSATEAEEAVEISLSSSSLVLPEIKNNQSTDNNDPNVQKQQQSSFSLFNNAINVNTSSPSTNITSYDSLLPGFEEINLNSSTFSTNNNNNSLLAELGLEDIDLTTNCSSNNANSSDFFMQKQQQPDLNNHQININEDLLK